MITTTIIRCDSPDKSNPENNLGRCPVLLVASVSSFSALCKFAVKRGWGFPLAWGRLAGPVECAGCRGIRIKQARELAAAAALLAGKGGAS